MDGGELKKIINKLDYYWYKDKKSTFEKEPLYNKEKQIIIAEIPVYKYLFDGDDNIIGEEIDGWEYADIDLRRYCLSGYFPGGMYEMKEGFRQHGEPLPDDANDVAHELSYFLEEETQSFVNPIAISNAITTFLALCTELTHSMVKSHNKAQYSELLGSFLNQLIATTYMGYSDELREAEYIDKKTDDTLEFNLSQKDLMALLFLMSKAGFLNTLDYNDASFLSFCYRHFRFKITSTYKKTDNFHTFYNKYNDAKNGKTSPSIDKIIKRLSEAKK